MNDEVNEILELPSVPNQSEIPIAPVRKSKFNKNSTLSFFFS